MHNFYKRTVCDFRASLAVKLVKTLRCVKHLSFFCEFYSNQIHLAVVDHSNNHGGFIHSSHRGHHRPLQVSEALPFSNPTPCREMSSTRAFCCQIFEVRMVYSIRLKKIIKRLKSTGEQCFSKWRTTRGRLRKLEGR